MEKMLEKAYAAKSNIEARLNDLRPAYQSLRTTWFAVEEWVNNPEAEIPAGFEEYRDFGGDEDEVAEAIFEKLRPQVDELNQEIRQAFQELNDIKAFLRQYSVSATFSPFSPSQAGSGP